MVKPVARHVMFLVPSLRGGGAERVIVTLLRHMDPVRFRVTLVVVNLHGAVYQDDVPDHVELVDLGCERVRYALPGIIRMVWRWRPEVVFSTLGHLNLAMAIVRPALPDSTRYIARESCVVSEIVVGYPWPRWWRWAYRTFYRRFDRVICQSQDMRDDLVSNFNVPSAKVTTIHNPLDIDRIRRLASDDEGPAAECMGTHGARPRCQLVAAGRLAHQKGFDLLIEAIALCHDPDIHLTILGDGPLRRELQALVLAKGLGAQVTFCGFQRNPYPFFARADAFVLSSRFEGFPNVILEALACGTPVIAVPAPGGVREILKNEGACVIADAVSSTALASAISGWRKRDATRLDAQAAAAPYAVGHITRLYEEVIG
jgi:glycosyltransferase involved in cell wall biosynthesis